MSGQMRVCVWCVDAGQCVGVCMVVWAGTLVRADGWVSSVAGGGIDVCTCRVNQGGWCVGG